METPQPLSIVVPAYNAADTIGLTISHLAAQEGLDSPPEVIVVDDGSRDDTAAVAERAGARVIRQANAGPACARNAGYRASTGRYVLFTDSDCLPDPHWAARLADGFDEALIGAVGGSYTMANEKSLLAAGIHWEIIARHRRFGRYVRALGSYNLAVRRDVMDAVRGFDEHFPSPSGEDNDLSYRISQAGCRLRWVPEATVAHYHTERLWKYLREQHRHGYWRARLLRYHGGRAGGDDYTTIKDVLEPALVVALAGWAFLLASGLVWPVLRVVALWGAAGTAAALAGVQIPMTARMVAASGRFSVITHAGVMILRAFARTLGFLRGLLSARTR